MTTVLFVHGTGVRNPGYEETFKLIEKTVHLERPDIKVERCLWGDELGTKLNAQGASIPLYDSTLALDEEEEDYSIVLWQQLYSNPLYELRVLSLKPGDETAGNPFGEQPGDELHSRVERLNPSPELQAKLDVAGIAEVFEQARDTVIQSEAYHQALQNASEELGEYRDAIARAIVAQAMFECEQQEKYPPILTDAELRDEVVKLLSLALGEAELGIGDWVVKPLSQLAQPIGTFYVKRRRGIITQSVSPTPCDILLYQGRGDRIRDFIRVKIEQAEPPVVLLAHSLGGIACVDLLVQQPLQPVELLITAGSQAPFFYEINALYSLEYGEPLPDYFPSWLNIYDLRDFLSYIGANVFPNKVQDVLVDSKQPFPRSHGAYWTNKAVWKAIIPRLP
ncbi:MAG: hypothetical protein RIM23_11855 [Coleofasciculus sp. G3-WIS-01]|uniref:hypothetical protein n=1 Tax=Coleofasciculus sp. G3-WIS-01 TaxID=3069528 RepID=UPI0032F1E2BE